MAKKNFYVVKVGKIPGIYKTWDECKEQTNGYPGADFKGTITYEEALAYLGGEIIEEKKPEPKKEETMVAPTCPAIAYVDGSYKESTATYGSGAIVIYDGKEYELASCGNDEELAEMRNVAGEIKGAEMAIQWALDNNVPSLVIYHDYQGISSWANGSWKTNKEGTKAYKTFCDNARKNLNLSFVKVKGHSGDKYNDIADRLAASKL